MKKRLLALLLTGIVVCSACAQTQGDSSENSTSQESQTDLPAQTDAEPEESQSSGQSIPVITVERRQLQRWTPDNETLLAEVAWDNMTLEGDGYEKAAETVSRLLSSDEEEMAGTADSYAEMAVDQYEAQKDEGWFANYIFSTSYSIARLDTRILSVSGNTYDYSGGAHGYGYGWGLTIDLQSGAELELSRMAADAPGFWKKVMELVLLDLKNREDELYEDYESYVKEGLESTGWYLDAAGIEFVFTPYEIGPYASGNIIVCVPYAEVADYMKPEYLAPEGEYILPVPLGKEVSDAEGVYHVLIENRQVEEYMWETVLQVNGRHEISLGDVALQSAYLLHRADGRTFLIFDIDWASDDYETLVYELTEQDAEEKASIGAKLDGRNVRLDKLNLIFTVDVLGTYSSEMYYTLGEEGELTPQEEVYQIKVYPESKGLTLIRQLPVTVEGQETILPEGSRLHVSATNWENTIWFEAVTPSGETVTGEIYYERPEEDYQIYIDGVSEYEYFEMLPYVG